MDCRELERLRDAYVDGELDLVRGLDAEEHLATCPACARSVAELQALREKLRGADMRHAAPPRLRGQVRAALRGAHRPTTRRRWLVLVPLAAVLAGIAVVLSGGPGGDDRLAAEAVSGHVRSLQAAHLFDVQSSDRHTVKPWFVGQLDFSPPVRDLGGQGFPLLGGRLDYLNGRPVAALVYGRERHRINLFVWPTGGGEAAPRLISRNGYQLVNWSRDGMTFWAVSDLNAEELRQFAEAFREAE